MLDESRSFDEYSQRLLMKYYLNCGVGGIATAVHSTQFEIRKPEIALFEPILKLVSEEITAFEKVNDKVIVKVTGVCGKTDQTVNEVLFDAANRFAGCITGLHYVLKKQGLMKSIYCLNPDGTLSPGQVEEFDRIYAQYPHHLTMTL